MKALLLTTDLPLIGWRSWARFACVATAVLSLALEAPAAVRYWDGYSTVSAYWNDAANWEPNGVPFNGEDLIFRATIDLLPTDQHRNTNNLVNRTFGSITFSSATGTFGSAIYEVQGNPLSLSGGLWARGTLNLMGFIVTNTFGPDIQLVAPQTFGCETGGVFMVTGDLNLGANLLTIDGEGVVQLTGSISGSGGLTKIGTGTLRLRGTGANSYTGITTVKTGTLLLGKGFLFGAKAVPGRLVVGDSIGGADADVVRLLWDNQIGNTSAVTVNRSGLLDLDGSSDVIGSLTVAGGHVETGAGLLILQGNLTNAYSTVTSNIRGKLALGGTNQVFHIVNSSVATDLRLAAALSEEAGPAGFRKTGAGTLELSGGNTYTGPTVVAEGMLTLNTASREAISGRSLTIGDGVGDANADVVRLNRSNQIDVRTAVTLDDTGLLDLRGYSDDIGSLAGRGRVDLGGGTLSTGYDNADTQFSGNITGFGGRLQKYGTGTMTLTGRSYGFTGSINVYGGTLVVNVSLPASDVTVASHSTLAGSGLVGDLSVNGRLAPGSNTGILACSNAVFAASSTFEVEINGPTAGTSHDQLNVRGTVTLNQPTLRVTLGYIPPVGAKFTLIRNDGTDAVQGTFSSLNEGATVVAGPVEFTISYSGGANDVVLTVTAVSTPAPIQILSCVRDGTNLTLHWQGGWPGFVIEKTTSLTPGAPWEIVMPPAAVSNFTVPMNTPTGFYRVQGGN